jgi:hypothetical protein
MKRKVIFIILAVLLLAPWPVAYAYGDASDASPTVKVEAATASAAPQWQSFGHAVCSVKPGDLFYVNTADSQPDVRITLLITNTDELIHQYRYMTMGVGVYVRQEDGGWEKAATGYGDLFPDTYITLLDGAVELTLPGLADYKITIDKGCFYCYGIRSGESAVTPSFYLTME